MSENSVVTLDLQFQKTSSVIAAYLIPHKHGAVLIESGPGSTRKTLLAEINKNGYSLKDITDVFLTHIHLDHAGAAGWLARNGATIHVHPFGAPHLLNPTKLLGSAARIYGEDMDRLWGEFLPVPKERLSVVETEKLVDIQGLQILPVDTPGHANHHMVYIINEICFSGDIGGVRIDSLPVIRIPMVPPEFHLGKWRASLDKISTFSIKAFAPTHFGITHDPANHLHILSKDLDQIETWMEQNMGNSPGIEELRMSYKEYVKIQDKLDNLNDKYRNAYELANPAFMSADGIFRYWNKFR